ncbi:Tar-like ligand binding protein [Modicisalibacter xianhensis]|uniref:Tar-like ligand binding protein n=1 Tax=Modicisalibacter xianhensis TaxID=442341 RepID=A0A4R8FSY3_9GAMM|nr:Tar ligand binding domain-containing protein [Halomonas xianhensis]TDX29765.1 Tar-like ligand binding protein [Halomonas xianhensis]
MKNLTVNGSLTAALLVLVLMIGAIRALGFYSNSTSARAIGELSEVNVEQTNAINRTQVSLLRARLMLESLSP